MRRGPKGVFPRDGCWWVRYKDADGREHREKVGPKKLAEEVYAKRRSQVAEGKFFPERELRRRVVPLKSYLNEFFDDHVAGKLKNADHEQRYVRLWTGALGLRPVRSITSTDVARYVAERQDAGKAPATVNRELAFLRKAMNHAIVHGLADRNPVGARNGGVKLARENNERARYLTDEEQARLQHEIADAHWSLIEFAVHTGFRQANQFKLRWSDVDFNASTIVARNPKGGKDYIVPMNATVRELLAALPSRLKGVFVFPSSTGTAMGSQNFMNRVFVPALRRAGIDDFHWHDLRHTFASRLVMAGVPLLTVSKLLGHATLAMTQRYAHLAPGHLADAVRNLDAKKNGTRSGTSKLRERTTRRRRPARA